MSPFDEARYARLLEGLEVSEISLSAIAASDTGYRWDSEFYRRAILEAKRKIDRLSGTKPIGAITPQIQHPVEVSRAYADQGYRVLLAQEVRNNMLSLGDGYYMDSPGEPFLRANRLERGDVVLTRSGANFGQCSPILLDDELYACADLLVIRKGSLPAGYVSTVLNTSHGRLLLDRGSYGMAQPHIAHTYVRTIPIPIFPLLIEPVSRMLDLAYSAKLVAGAMLKEAETKLLHALGLDNWEAPGPLTYIRSSRDAFSASRIDAEFFAPRVRDMLARLGRDGLTIQTVAPVRKERFTPADSGAFYYIEIGGLIADGTAQAEHLPQREAPSRATQYVRAGDVITSTVRPIRRLSAAIDDSQDGYVCSSGFVVLQPRAISSDVLLTYMRLPPVCTLMDLHTSASMYPAISEADLLALPIPEIPAATQQAIEKSTLAARQAKLRATQLLEAAKRAVEIAIEQGEITALDYVGGVDGYAKHVH